MPYVAPRKTIGFEFNYNKAGFSGNPVPYLLKANTAFKKGMVVGMTLPGVAEGGAIFPWVAATRCDQNVVVGVMAESIAQADNPAAEDTYGLVYDNPLNVYRATFVPGINGDVAVTSGTTTTVITATAFSNDTRAAGSTIIFYEGPGSKTVRRISSATASTNTLTWLEPIGLAPTDATKFMLLGAADLDTAGGGIGVGAVGLAVNNDSLRVNANAAPHLTQQPVICLAIDPWNMWMDVMLQGMLAGR